MNVVRAVAILALVSTSCRDSGGMNEPPAPRTPRLDLVYRLPTPTRAEASPALCDLDGDGDLEVLTPFEPPDDPLDDQIVAAFDARTGNRLWEGPAGTYLYGSAACVPTPAGMDVLATGRSGDVIRIDGRTGAELWRLTTRNPESLPPAGIPGFSSTVVVDVEAGLAATTFAGFAGNSIPGRLIVFDLDGHVLAVRETPVGTESYASPAVSRDRSGSVVFAFGSGGETKGGTMELLRFDPPGTLTLVGSVGSLCDSGGFVASPTFADLDHDGEHELVAADYCGGVFAIELDGSTPLASKLDGGYASSNPIAAELDGDPGLEIVAVFSDFNPSGSGIDDVRTSRVLAIAWETGTLLWTREIPGLALASPIALDVDDDAIEDVLVQGVSFEFSDPVRAPYGGHRWLSGRTGEPIVEWNGIGSMGTPVLDDVDADGSADLFLVDAPHGNPAGSTLLRIELVGVPYLADSAYSGFRGHPGGVGSR